MLLPLNSDFSLVDEDLVCLLYALHALLWINDPQALDNLEFTVLRLGNVDVHSNVMLTGHHFSWTTRPLSDLRMVECLDDIFLLERACLFHSSLPEPQTSV